MDMHTHADTKSMDMTMSMMGQQIVFQMGHSPMCKIGSRDMEMHFYERLSIRSSVRSTRSVSFFLLFYCISSLTDQFTTEKLMETTSSDSETMT